MQGRQQLPVFPPHSLARLLEQAGDSDFASAETCPGEKEEGTVRDTGKAVSPILVPSLSLHSPA